MAKLEISKLEIQTLKQAQEAIRATGACEESVPLMAPKLIHLVLRIRSVRTPVGNILKQECLSLGAEAAVSQWTVNCSKERTGVVLAGSLAQLRKLVVKLKMQGYGLPKEVAGDYAELAKEIGKVLEKYKA